MMLLGLVLALYCATSQAALPFHYSPYYRFFRYSQPYYYNSYGNYANHIPTYTRYVPTYHHQPLYEHSQIPYVSQPLLPTLNVLAERPYRIENSLTVVPMVLVSRDTINTITSGHIMNVSSSQPVVTIKTPNSGVLQCTPAVRIVLDSPVLVYDIKSSILFPSEMVIAHENARIPIHVGAVIAPITKDTPVSPHTPVVVTVVYAIPTRPVSYDYVNNEQDVVVEPDNQAVVVESSPNKTEAVHTVTILNFAEVEAQPVLSVGEGDDELVNRNPPEPLAPAGIVQSTQPIIHEQVFTNSKESPILTALREEANKHRLRQ